MEVSASGSGMETSSSMQAVVGSEVSIVWPLVGIESPDSSALRLRSSTGSKPSSPASRSICASAAKHDCTVPKPRIAPHGGLLVRTAMPSTLTLSTR